MNTSLSRREKRREIKQAKKSKHTASEAPLFL